eukprot:1835416-Amphidinium_carterae.1
MFSTWWTQTFSLKLCAIAIPVVLQQAYKWRCQLDSTCADFDPWIQRLKLCRLEQWSVTALSSWAKFVHEFHILGAWWNLHDIIRSIIYSTQPWAYIVWEAIRDRSAKEWAASAMVSAQAWRTWASHECATNGKALYKWIKRDEAIPSLPSPSVANLPQAGHVGALA